MKIRQALFSPVALLLLVGVAGGAAIWWGSTPAQAQTAGAWNTAVVPIRGTVGGVPESVAFSGRARVESKLALDPDFNKPSLVLSIDLTGVSGVGSSTGAKYVIGGPEQSQRRVAASQVVEFTFPFARSGAMDLGSAQSGVASFALNFDTNTGAVTSASGYLASAR